MDTVALLGRNNATCLTNEFFNGLLCDPVNIVLDDNFLQRIKKLMITPIGVSLFIFHYNASLSYILPKIESLKKTHPSIPIIMTADKADNDVTRWALRSRMWDCILLPGELDYLRETIKRVLELNRLKNDSGRLIVFPGKRIPNKAAMFQDKISSKIDPALIFISNNYEKKIKVSGLAKLCNMSNSSFSLRFRLQMGVNLRTYLRDYRINVAKKLLTETNLKINAIANSSGFEEVSQFNRQFKSIVFTTPSEFRHKVC